MKVLLVGDIVGKPGRNAFVKVAGRLKDEGRVDFSARQRLPPDLGANRLQTLRRRRLRDVNQAAFGQAEAMERLFAETDLVRSDQIGIIRDGKGGEQAASIVRNLYLLECVKLFGPIERTGPGQERHVFRIGINRDPAEFKHGFSRSFGNTFHEQAPRGERMANLSVTQALIYDPDAAKDIRKIP